MIRGGDTPKQETLWAIEFESGKFAFGHTNEDKIFVATSEIGRQIWYANGNGVVAGSTESVDEVTDTIIDTYNQYFGTEISHLTPDTELLKVGDTIQNWNAYEKIEIQSKKIAVKINETAVGDLFIIGTLSGENFEIITNGNQSCIVRSNGVSEGFTGPPASQTDFIKGLLQGVGITATSISEEVVSWEPGSTIPDWSEYTQYT